MNPLVKWSTLARRGIVGPAFAEVDRLHPGLDPSRRRHEAQHAGHGRRAEPRVAVLPSHASLLYASMVEISHGLPPAARRADETDPHHGIPKGEAKHDASRRSRRDYPCRHQPGRYAVRRTIR